MVCLAEPDLRLTPILRKALQSAIVDQVARSLDRSSELVSEPEPAAPARAPAAVLPIKSAPASTASTHAAEPRAGVVTTPDEIEANRLIVTWVREASANAPLGYRDSKSYFTVHQDNVRKWFVRLGLEEKPMWVALRHIKPDEAKNLAPGVEVAESARFGDSRLLLTSLADLSKLRTVIIAAYEREAARKDEGPSETVEV